ncbi:MAG: hypothetical protein MJ162_03435 [Treponema sp.]|nr:hypothetical protein [Treponema sp.]
MKKILLSLGIFLVAGFLVCFVVGMCVQIPVEVPAKSVFIYKFYNAITYFLMFLPALFMTGFVVAFSVHFGRNPEGSTNSFSHAMLDRFKMILIPSLVMVLILTLSNETFGLLVKRRQQSIINRPKIIAEYIKVGNNLYENKLYERSLAYAMTALELDPNSQEARDLKSKADIEINRQYTSTLRFDLTSAQPLIIEDNSLKIDGDKITEAFECYKKAREAFAKEEWFNAHYYSELGLKLCTSKDPNYENLKVLSAEAWNNLSQVQKFEKTEEEFFFEQKYKGYKALMEKDDLQAYYIFQFLLANYIEMQRDSDVNFYYEIARERIEQKYFFMDETFELSSFENANDVHFSYTLMNGERAIVYFKGLTNVKATGQSVQYLRDLSIVYLNERGEWRYTIHTPYAKVMPVSVENINAITKSMLGISEETKQVPYILLKSISRDKEDYVCAPVHYMPDGRVKENVSDYLLFPIEYKDFLMVENSPETPETSTIFTLFKFAGKAAEYGYSAEKYGQVLLNRLLYPLFLLCIFILLGSFAWNNRIGATQYFRFSWVFFFPIFIVVSMLLYNLLMFLFKLLNYAFLEIAGGLSALWVGFGVYLFVMIILSIYFLSRNSKV